MQMLTVTTLVMMSYTVALTAAFGSSLRQEIFGSNDYYGDTGIPLGLQDTGFRKEAETAQLSKTVRDLADSRKKRVTTDTSGELPNTIVPPTSSGSGETRDDKSVHTGTGQTVDVLKPYPEPNDVGFHVSLSHAKAITGSDGTVVFDTINESTPAHLNGYYNERTGKFTSPVTGTYLVSLSIANKADDVMLASVYVNQSYKKLTVVSDGRNGITQGSQTGYVKMNKNDVLSVSINRPTHAQLYGNNLSSFSVYLLKKQ